MKVKASPSVSVPFASASAVGKWERGSSNMTARRPPQYAGDSRKISELAELIDRTGESRMFRIADVQLVPSRHVTATFVIGKQHRHTHAFGEAHSADDVFSDHAAAAPNLGAKLLETADPPVVEAKYRPPKK